MSKDIKVQDICAAIETFAPKRFQEDYDNAGLQVGNPKQTVTGVLLCLDVTEDVVREAMKRQCNMIVSHHPLLFRGLKEVTGATASQRIVIEAILNGIAIYSAHTNLDSAWEGVSYEMAHMLGLTDITPLAPREDDPRAGLGVIADIRPVPAIQFLRKVKETFAVKCMRFSAQSPQLVIRRVAACSGSGASFIRTAIAEKADVIVTADVKYHDFADYGPLILIADIGHYESEICTKKIFSRIIREKFLDCVTYFAESDRNPVGYM